MSAVPHRDAPGRNIFGGHTSSNPVAMRKGAGVTPPMSKSKVSHVHRPISFSHSDTACGLLTPSCISVLMVFLQKPFVRFVLNFSSIEHGHFVGNNVRFLQPPVKQSMGRCFSTHTQHCLWACSCHSSQSCWPQQQEEPGHEATLKAILTVILTVT